MTTTINRFSVRRLWTVAKRDAALDWKTNLAHFLEFAGALLAGLVIIMLPAKTDGNSFNVIADTFYSWFSLVLTVGGLIAASSMLKPISDKTGSISLLTLPATNAEKFVERALMVTVGYTISALAALVVVGVLYYPLAFIFGIDSYGSLTAYCTQSFFAPTFDNINTQVSVESQIVVMAWQWRGQLLAWGYLLWMQSLFVLGGTVWRKFAFVKTLGIVFVLGIVFSIVLVQAWHPATTEEFYSTYPVFLVTTGSLCLAFAVVNWAVAYRLFVGKQIVETKKTPVMNFKESRPIYLQIADRIMDEIMQHAYSEGGRIPSVREYAATVEVNANTVVRSFDWLQQQEIIFNRRGIGYFVSEGACGTISRLRRREFEEEELSEMFRKMQMLGITADDIDRLYKQFIDSGK